MIWTDYEVVVEETLAGPVRESPTIVSFAGGQHENQFIEIHGMPELVVGERYILFLHPQSNIMSASIGWGQGILESVDIEDAAGSRTVLLSYDGRPLQTDQNNQLVRGAPVQVQDGKLVSLPPQQLRGERAPDPIVYDADGNVIPQDIMESQFSAASLPETEPAFATLMESQFSAASLPETEPAFASLDDLRLFLQEKADEE